MRTRRSDNMIMIAFVCTYTELFSIFCLFCLSRCSNYFYVV